MAAAVVSLPLRRQSRLNCLHCTDAVRCIICTGCVWFFFFLPVVIHQGDWSVCRHCTPGFYIETLCVSVDWFDPRAKVQTVLLAASQVFTRLGECATWHQCNGSGGTDISTVYSSPQWSHWELATVLFILTQSFSGVSQGRWRPMTPKTIKKDWKPPCWQVSSRFGSFPLALIATSTSHFKLLTYPQNHILPSNPNYKVVRYIFSTLEGASDFKVLWNRMVRFGSKSIKLHSNMLKVQKKKIERLNNSVTLTPDFASRNAASGANLDPHIRRTGL